MKEKNKYQTSNNKLTMYCRKCGKEIPVDSAFCYACGEPVVFHEKGTDPSQSEIPYKPAQNRSQSRDTLENQKKKAGHSGIIIAIIMIILVIIVALIILLVGNNKNHSLTNEDQESTQSFSQSSSDLDEKAAINNKSGVVDLNSISKSVLLLYCFDDKDALVRSGSGFVAFDGKTIVTNYHVIEGISKIIAVDETNKEIIIYNIINYDIDRDIAILSAIANTGLTPLSLGDSTTVVKGDEIYTIGSPEGLINTVSSGLLSGELLIGNQSYLQISAPISSGSSGGVLLNKTGQVIGVTSSGLIEGQNLNFAIPINDVIEMYNKPVKNMFLSECTEENSKYLRPGLEITGTMVTRPYPTESKPCLLHVDTSGYGIYYVILKRTGGKNISFLVNGGDSFEIQIPSDRFYLYYGFGSVWNKQTWEFEGECSYYKNWKSLQTDKDDYYITLEPNPNEDTGFSMLSPLETIF